MKRDKAILALSAICNTFIPAVTDKDDPTGYWRRTPDSMLVPEKILGLIDGAKQEDQAAFKQLLWLLSSPILGLTWGGPLKPVDRLSPEQREKMLHSWAKSKLPELRNAFNTLRKLSAILFYGDIPSGKTANPNWDVLGYQPETGPPPPDKKPLRPLQPGVDFSTSLHCDILVIGSGAGGSIVAAELAAAGKDVLILDKGVYTPTDQFTRQEFPMLNRHFEAGALLNSKNGAITVLAGSTVGGGTTVNWAASLQTPDSVLEEWATLHGNPHFIDPAYKKGFEYVVQRNQVSDHFEHNPQNGALLRGAQQLGYKASNIPMNLVFPADLPAQTAWEQAGFSCLGDAYGIKQGAAQTFLCDAQAHGARLLANAKVERLVIQQGKATGAIAKVLWNDGKTHPLEINANCVVVSAGALQTPVLLIKSGIKHPQIGHNLFLHPVVAMPGIYEQQTLPWFGPMMSAVVQEFAQLDGNFGFRIECPPVHPGLGAMALSWENGQAFKEEILQLRHTGVFLALVRDRFGGRVTVGKRSSEPIIHYSLHTYDRQHIIRGMQEMARLHFAAGAQRISILHNQPEHFYPGNQEESSVINRIKQKPWEINQFGLFSAHQMGTARMGGNQNYPVTPEGSVRGVKNVFIADTSLFPAASGVNPMLSVQALAYWVAQNIKQFVL
jgi:choline dehydrogenase-like flavoprotein